MNYSFDELVRQLQLGEPSAAEQFLATYGEELRRAVRVRLTDPRLRRTLESVDICQSVFLAFFNEIGTGHLQFQGPAQLRALLVKMANNKVIDHVRKARARQYDQHVLGPEAQELLAASPDQHSRPDDLLANQELAEQVRRFLSPQERYLADQHALGREWNDLALELNNTPEALRKQYKRALERVKEHLGLDSHERL